jgi:hypothetical protein
MANAEREAKRTRVAIYDARSSVRDLVRRNSTDPEEKAARGRNVASVRVDWDKYVVAISSVDNPAPGFLLAVEAVSVAHLEFLPLDGGDGVQPRTIDGPLSVPTDLSAFSAPAADLPDLLAEGGVDFFEDMDDAGPTETPPE